MKIKCLICNRLEMYYALISGLARCVVGIPTTCGRPTDCVFGIPKNTRNLAFLEKTLIDFSSKKDNAVHCVPGEFRTSAVGATRQGPEK